MWIKCVILLATGSAKEHKEMGAVLTMSRYAWFWLLVYFIHALVLFCLFNYDSNNRHI